MRILVEEDDHISRTVLGRMLEPYGMIDSAVDGTVALGKHSSQKRLGNPNDLIMLDLLTTGLDGREVLREIGSGEEAEGICAAVGVKIIMVTAPSSYGDIAEAFREQCDGYLTKPVEKKQLEQALAAVGFPPPNS